MYHLFQEQVTLHFVHIVYLCVSYDYNHSFTLIIIRVNSDYFLKQD
jgi:hypothetical protein